MIHSDLSPAARAAAINKFRIGETWVLIATDLLGRGLDFLGLNTVVNYDFPQVGVGVSIQGSVALKRRRCRCGLVQAARIASI